MSALAVSADFQTARGIIDNTGRTGPECTDDDYPYPVAGEYEVFCRQTVGPGIAVSAIGVMVAVPAAVLAIVRARPGRDWLEPRQAARTA